MSGSYGMSRMSEEYLIGLAQGSGGKGLAALAQDELDRRDDAEAVDAAYRDGIREGYRNGQAAEAARHGMSPAPPRRIPLTETRTQ